MVQSKPGTQGLKEQVVMCYKQWLVVNALQCSSFGKQSVNFLFLHKTEHSCIWNLMSLIVNNNNVVESIVGCTRWNDENRKIYEKIYCKKWLLK